MIRPPPNGTPAQSDRTSTPQICTIAGAALAATLGAESSIPVASVALVLGIHRLMSQGLTPTDLLGNTVATIVMAKKVAVRTAFNQAECRRP
jgi:Na+/H+-dicarboxylate symporter